MKNVRFILNQDSDTVPLLGQDFRFGWQSSLCALLLCVSADVSFAQAPGWSRGQQSLALTYDDCVRRMPAALQAEGYRRDDNPGGNFAVGIKDVHTAVIICSPAPDSKMLIHVIVASNGDGGGRERQCLQAQIERPGRYSGCGNGGSSGCGMGTVWNIVESGLNTTWTRRGNSNVFDVTATIQGNPFSAEQVIEIRGNKVFINRYRASDGNTCNFEGAIQSDGRSVTGTYDCTRYKPTGGWRATINCN